MSCILHHRGIQQVLACSKARPANLVAGMGREGMFFISSVSSWVLTNPNVNLNRMHLLYNVCLLSMCSAYIYMYIILVVG